MIERYWKPEMKAIWQDKNRYQKWLDVEVAACEANSKLGLIPADSLATIKSKANFDVVRIEEIENTTHHDVIAFLTSVAEYVGPDSRYIHLGMTSSDVVDTAFALLLVESSDIILKDLEEVIKSLRERAGQHKGDLMIGRSHGIHAEPITFALKVGSWLMEMERNLFRMKQARENIAYGKISGAVGTYANIDPSVEEYVCKVLGLKAEPISTQIINRDRHAELMSTMGIIASSIDRVATEIRNLQRTDVLEAEEPFREGQKGSSAMPHKRNPVLCERLSGMARMVRANSLVAMENIVLWHERDISHSSTERMIVPDSFGLLDNMLQTLDFIIKNMKIYPQNMRDNMDVFGGVIFSQRVLLELVGTGMTREDAYKIVQTHAHAAWNNKSGSFRDNLLNDPVVVAKLGKDNIIACFDPVYHLKNVEHIYKKLGI